MSAIQKRIEDVADDMIGRVLSGLPDLTQREIVEKYGGSMSDVARVQAEARKLVSKHYQRKDEIISLMAIDLRVDDLDEYVATWNEKDGTSTWAASRRQRP